jgi:DNA-binding beta-propeller fold protein YncE
MRGVVSCLLLFVPSCFVSFDEGLLAKRDATVVGHDARTEGPAVGDARQDAAARDLLSPDLPADCKVDGDCDDGLACTSSVCSGGKCVHTREPGFCVIGAQCVAAGAASAGNPCLGCDPAKDPTKWSPLDGSSCDDGVACTHTDRCSAGVCQGTPYTCNDGLSCTTDSCTGTGPSPAGCSTKLVAGFCLIDKTCYASGATAPGKPCDSCDPAKNTTAWTSDPSCVTTIAGDGTAGFANGSALSGRLNQPYGLIVASGTIYIADELNQRIRSLVNGTLATVAGSGTIGAQDGPAAQATFSAPHNIIASGSGFLVADTDNHRIRQIVSGQVSTLAGSSTGFQDGPLLTAQFAEPKGMAVDTSGKVYVADFANHCIRTIAGGQVSTLAGNGNPGAQDGPISAARFRFPRDVAVDATGRLYVADSANHKIRLIWNGQVSTFAGSGFAGFQNGAALTARFNTPYALALASGDRIFVADNLNHRIRLIENGQVTTSAGSGTAGFKDGSPATAQFNQPTGVAVSSTSGRVYVADHLNNRIRGYTP